MGITGYTCDDLSVVRSAGQAFGDFQMLLSDFDAEQLFYTIPDFHNTRKRYEKLKADMASDPCGRVSDVRDELDWLLSMEDEACKLTDLFNAGKLPLRVTHAPIETRSAAGYHGLLRRAFLLFAQVLANRRTSLRDKKLYLAATLDKTGFLR